MPGYTFKQYCPSLINLISKRDDTFLYPCAWKKAPLKPFGLTVGEIV